MWHVISPQSVNAFNYWYRVSAMRAVNGPRIENVNHGNFWEVFAVEILGAPFFFFVQTHFPTLWSLAVDNHRFSAKSAITIICRSYLQFTVVILMECHRVVSGWKRQREANQCLFYKISARSSLNSRQWLFTFDCPFLHVKKKETCKREHEEKGVEGTWWDKLLPRCGRVVRWLCNSWVFPDCEATGGKLVSALLCLIRTEQEFSRAFFRPSRLTEESRDCLVQMKPVDWLKPECCHCATCTWQIVTSRDICVSPKRYFLVPYDTCCEMNTPNYRKVGFLRFCQKQQFGSHSLWDC